MYIPGMTMRTLVPKLRQSGINYDDSSREYGDSQNKGVFTNLEVKVAEKNDKLLIPDKAKPDELVIPDKAKPDKLIISDKAKPDELIIPDKPITSFSGKTLAKNSVDTWSQRLKKLDSLGLQSALDNNAYDVVENIITDESASLNTRCTSITAILNRLYNETKITILLS